MKRILLALALCCFALPAFGGGTTVIGPSKSLAYAVDASKAGFTNISTSVATIGTTPATLQYATNQTINNKTIPATLTLQPVNGALITVNSGKTLQGHLPGGNDQLYAGSGSVIYSAGSVPAINPAWFPGTDTQKVQIAVNTSAASGWLPLSISRQYDLSSGPVNIDRMVDTMTGDLFIIGTGPNAGFYSSATGPMFSSTISTTTDPKSEHVTFNRIRFESSANTVNNFVLSGDKFLRVSFINGCWFEKIRLAFTNNYFQSIYLNDWKLYRWKGIFLAATKGYEDIKATNFQIENGDASSEVFNTDPTGAYLSYGSHFGPGLFEYGVEGGGPFLTGSMANGDLIGLHTEKVANPVVKLLYSFAFNVTGNVFIEGATALANSAYYNIDCGTGINCTSGGGNYTNGKLFKTASLAGGGEGFLSNGGDYAALALTDKRTSNQFSGTGTFTGFTTTVTGTVTASIQGNIVTLNLPAITGTSNATTMTLTGVPIGFLPQSPRNIPVSVENNGTWNEGIIALTSSTITFYATRDGQAFTNSGTKAVYGNSITYSILP
jgi:hypothetical protein